jgi:hypothetical protein
LVTASQIPTSTVTTVITIRPVSPKLVAPEPYLDPVRSHRATAEGVTGAANAAVAGPACTTGTTVSGLGAAGRGVPAVGDCEPAGNQGPLDPDGG